VVEQSAVNRSVAGSNPACGASIKYSQGLKMNKNEEEIIPEDSEQGSASEEDAPSSSIIEVNSIPDGVTIFDQTHWAWLLPSSIWIILLSGVVVYDFISMGFIPLLMAIAIIVPRYLRWKQTKYYLSDDALYITMVGLPIIQKRRIFMLPFDDIVDTNLKYGTFGKTLNYAEVQVVFQDQRVAKLSYIGDYAGFISHIADRTDLTKTS
tara:strand:+ start:205 stop:828 length:624 start_codon:yes stop_codon:yes gene_type:complete